MIDNTESRIREEIEWDVEELEDRVNPQLTANHNESLVRDILD